MEAPRRRPSTVIGMTGSPGPARHIGRPNRGESVQRGEKLAVVAYDMSPIAGGVPW